MIAIIPERVIGMPQNTDRHRPESPQVTYTEKVSPQLQGTELLRKLNSTAKTPIAPLDPPPKIHFELWRRGWDSNSVPPLILCKLLILLVAPAAGIAPAALVGYSFGTAAKRNGPNISGDGPFGVLMVGRTHQPAVRRGNRVGQIAARIPQHSAAINASSIDGRMAVGV
jgi:hypothetical protein